MIDSNVLDDLLLEKSITRDEMNLYQLFKNNELGASFLAHGIKQSFMSVPIDKMDACTLAYAEGERSMYRYIQYTIDKVESMLKKIQN